MKKIVLCVVLAVCAFGANAQELSPEEVAKLKKEMNDIKRSEDFVFAEGFAEYLSDEGDKAVSQATQQSMMKLQTQVMTVFAQHLHMSKEDVQAIWDVIEDKCQNVEITAGDVTRSFFYVSKEVLSGIMPDINLFPNRKKKAEQLEAATPAPTPVAQPEIAQAEPIKAEPVVAQNAEPVVAQVVEAKKEEQEVKVEETVKAEETVAVEEKKAEPETKAAEVQTQVIVQTQTTQVAVVTQTVEEAKQEAAAVKSETVVVNSEPVVVKSEAETVKSEPVVVETPKKETPVVETPAPAPAPTPAPTPAPEPAPAPAAVKVAVPDLCQAMLDKKNYKALISYLQTEKAYEKLIYGPESRMARTAQCYIVIVDKATQNIVTVLDKGVTERVNFVTGAKDDLANYMLAGGYLAIFVQEL